ncbi:S8 family serine peptidase [Streptomyces sp. NPDC059740]|uniref:S8 family peptidase n=1 Tax=Streptomyces sp. NPDC059740 TaxID=3346926 RepID=UPI003665FC7B
MAFVRSLRAASGAVLVGALLLGAAPVASADQVRNDQWPLEAFGAQDVWKVSTGKNVTVAVIDDPVDGQHNDLKGNVLQGTSFLSGGGRGDVAVKGAEHGTAMASLIAGHGHGPNASQGVMGIAPDAKILPVGVDQDWGPALRYAVDHHAQVVNMSFGEAAYSAAEKSAVRYAREHDVLVVAAAGNSGVDHLGYPASASGVLAVGAVDDNLHVWKYSNYASNVKIIAPGVNIRSASPGNGYHLANGTSDAAAYVSGAAALLRSKFPDLTAGQIANRLIKTTTMPSDKKDLKLPDPHYGYGIMRPYSALTKDVPAGPKDGPFPPLSQASGKSSSSPGAKDDGGTTAPNLSSDSSSSGLVISIIVGVVVIVLLVIVLIIVSVKRKNRRNGPPPGGGPGGGWGGPGGGVPGGYAPPPGQQPGGYQPQMPPQYQPPSSAPNYPPAPPQ